jgi:hypothetical protein
VLVAVDREVVAVGRAARDAAGELLGDGELVLKFLMGVCHIGSFLTFSSWR